MRIRFFLSFAALTLGATASVFAQTPAPAAPGSAPVPTPIPADATQAFPAYGQPQSQPQTQQQTAPSQSAPIPEKKGPTVAVPATPTEKSPYIGYPAYAPAVFKPPPDRMSSVYIPVDSWVYPALSRLYSMGFLDTMYLGMRPYTRRSMMHMLIASKEAILNSDNEEAQGIFEKLWNEVSAEIPSGNIERGLVYGLDSSYTRFLGISGPILRDSYHLGQTISNDYGRPYDSGFNTIAGASTTEEWGPFSLYVRGEYQHAPSGTGYSAALAAQLASIDLIKVNVPLTTTPSDPLLEQNPFRLVEAYASAHLLGHEISGGKTDAWLGPAAGSSMAWSNNAENIYSFRVNRIEPLNIRYLSKLLGPVRYDFFVGSLKGHMVPRSPWVHAEMFSFVQRRTLNLDFSGR